ncbi:MAG TPA: hypothetical protein VF622_11170 [Segetibacter sp.]|jgi:hypothetical protein
MSEKLKELFIQEKRKTSHYDEYRILEESEKKIFLSIYPGDTGQSAVTDIIIDDQEIKTGIRGTIEDYLLGTNKSLHAKTLEVYTAITDIQADTDLTTFKFHLKGGTAPYYYEMQKTVQSHGETIIYKMTIFFTIY